MVILFAGCAVGPNYQRPPVETPEAHRFDTRPATNSLADLPWWEVFKDPVLQEHIRTSLANNHDLRQAVARVEQARNLAVATRAPLFPQVGYGGNVGYGRNALFNSPTFVNGNEDGSANVLLSAVWEIDVWGRIRRLGEAARAQYLATDEARVGVTITLVSDVALTYLQLLNLDDQLRVQRASTNAFGESYRIFDQRRAQGIASKLETDRAAAALATAAADIPALELAIALTENQLGVLLGQPPGPVSRGTLTGLAQFPPEIPAGLPGDLLQRRPDVLGAEQSLVAANANVGASFANYFPQIGLTTFMGRVSPELSAFSAGAGNAWNLGATLAGPLFRGGEIRAQYRAAKARFDEATAAYEQTVLRAFQEVSNTLVSRQKFSEQRVFTGEAVTALKSAVDLATQRYLNGKSSYFEVLQAQQELYPAQRAEVQSQTDELNSVVQLYRALGGGWQTEAETPAEPAP